MSVKYAQDYIIGFIDQISEHEFDYFQSCDVFSTRVPTYLQDTHNLVRSIDGKSLAWTNFASNRYTDVY